MLFGLYLRAIPFGKYRARTEGAVRALLKHSLGLAYFEQTDLSGCA